MKTIRDTLMLALVISVSMMSITSPVVAEDKLIIKGDDTIIYGDPKGDPCRNSPELVECGGDGGEPYPRDKPKDPKKPKKPKN